MFSDVTYKNHLASLPPLGSPLRSLWLFISVTKLLTVSAEERCNDKVLPVVLSLNRIHFRSQSFIHSVHAINELLLCGAGAGSIKTDV